MSKIVTKLPLTTLMQINSYLVDNGFSIEFNNKKFDILYQKKVWSKTNEEIKEMLLDNLSYAVSMHLPMVLNNCSGIYYNTGRPLFEPYFFQNFLRDIPSNTEVDGTNTDEIVRKFLHLDYIFRDNGIKNSHQATKNTGSSKAIVAMSFGKDSLLSFAIAEEIGLNPETVYIVESSLTYEEKHKVQLGKSFEKEFGKKLNILKHETGRLRDYDYLNLQKSEFGWGLQSTEYALELLPFAYYYNANNIIFGNEQSTAESYYDQEKRWKIYPCYDQTHLWTKHINQMIQIISNQSINTISIIEPLMDIMIQRILIRRYPKYAKYQMSCFTENETGKDYRWCQECTVCAKMYLLSVAGGMDPKKIGFTKNMLMNNKKHFFTLFGGKSNLTYLNTGLGRDEQLFAFLIASKRNVEGDLLSIFKSSEFFQEAKDRFEELYKIFCKIYDPITIPNSLKEKVISIYKEEMELIDFL
ncbi:MAG: hypothetical protein ACFFD1_03230 [Candidatus Thorarchaeota archaeon]